MKAVHKTLTIFLVGIGLSATAQTPPPPPEPPAPPSVIYEDETTKVTTNSSNVSVITQNGDYGKGGNTSFSVSSSDDEYSIKSRFPKNRYPALKEYLMRELGTKGMQSDGTDLVWSLEGDEDTVYEVALSEKKFKVNLDKSLASAELIASFEDMGNIARTLVSGGDKRQEISRLERDAERARRDAERMQREAERLQKLSERESARLAQEAERLSREADKLSLISQRGGGIDGYVREVLSHPSTKYDPNTSGNNSWQWPNLQKALLTDLEKDNLISKNEDIVLTKEDGGMYVNGQRLSPTLWSSYNSLFRKYDYRALDEISFFKAGDHIVVLNGPSDFDELLETLEDENLIRGTNSNSTIEINGSSVVIDGIKLSQAQTDRWNTILKKAGVIPAPGKTIKIGEDFASIGYSFGKNTLGFWMSRD